MKRYRNDDLFNLVLNPLTNKPYSQRYFFLKEKSKQLPIHPFYHDIKNIIKSNQFVILSAETGSGKTTQVSQYLTQLPFEVISDDGMIVCTQPSRVAAMSMAGRVAEEMDVELGKEVGYNVRFDHKLCEKVTRLAYFTDGMLLREFLADANLSKVNAVVIDEAHQRTVHTDVLIGLLKLLCARRPELKVVIMSATLDTESFKSFFPQAAIIDIPGKMFPVRIQYSPTPVKDYVMSAVEKVIEIHKRVSVESGDILVFMAGESDIKRCIQQIYARLEFIEVSCSSLFQKNDEDDDNYQRRQRSGGAGSFHLETEVKNKCVVLPLYGSLPLVEQAKIFEKTEEGIRKIVVATNIAETSLTIDGIVYVVDSCMHKQFFYNPVSRVNYLLPTIISKASTLQRAGRAGRTRPGQCYRLITESTFESLVSQSYPDVMIRDMTDTILTLLRLELNPMQFPFITQPSQDSLLDAFFHLTFLGAIDDDCAITDLGRKIVEFPLNVSSAKAILSAERLRCTLDVAAICSILEVGNYFLCHSDKNNRRKEDNDCNVTASDNIASFVHLSGDHLSLLMLFHGFLESNNRAEWCKKVGLQYNVLIQAANIYDQVRKVMNNCNIKQETVYSPETKEFKDSIAVRKSLLSGFFSNVGYRSLKQDDYMMVRSNQKVKLHFSSKLCDKRPRWVLFGNLEKQGTDVFARMATEVHPQWLKEVNTSYFDTDEIENPDIKALLMQY